MVHEGGLPHIQSAGVRGKLIDRFAEWLKDDNKQALISELLKYDEPIGDDLLPPRIDGLAKQIVDVFNALQTQYIPSFGGVIGINYNSLKIVAKIHGLKLTKVTLELFQRLEYAALERSRDDADNADSVAASEPKVDWSGVTMREARTAR